MRVGGRVGGAGESMHSHGMHAGRQLGSLQLLVRSDEALISVTGWHRCTFLHLVFLVIYLHVLSSILSLASIVVCIPGARMCSHRRAHL